MLYAYVLAILLGCFSTSVIISSDQLSGQNDNEEVAQNDQEDLWSEDQIGKQQSDEFSMDSEVQEIAPPLNPEQEDIAGQGTTEIIVSDFEAPEELEDEVKDVEGLHTVGKNEPEGNWLFKRIWWEKSKNIYSKMRDRVDKIVESRMHFFSERVKLDRQYTDPFYVNIGFDQGVLTEVVNHLYDLLKLDREQVGMLNAKELEQYNLVLEEKEKLAVLQAAVADVKQLDDALDDALEKLMQQVNLARSYERQAWQLLEAIAEELSDKKAREHYYVVATLWRNVKDVGEYIVGPFTQHFFEVATKVVQQIKIVEDSIAELKAKGVQLSKEIESAHESCPDEEEPEVEQEEPVHRPGWIEWIGGLFSWKIIVTLLLMILGIALIVYRKLKK